MGRRISKGKNMVCFSIWSSVNFDNSLDMQLCIVFDKDI